MTTGDDYLRKACDLLDRYTSEPPSPHGRALPTQLQSINVALILAIADLIDEMKLHRDGETHG